MRLKRSRHLSYANVVSTICLMLLIGGGSAYALSISGKQIKNGTVTGTDVKNGSLTGSDVKVGSVSSSRLSSSARSELTDTSPWETIPSGKTITGSFNFDLSASAPADFAFVVPFGGRAPVPIVSSSANFAADAFNASVDDDATCTGTISVPTAPAGKVCGYLNSASGESTNLAISEAVGVKDTGFVITWTDSYIGPSPDAYVNGSWAYTAP